MVYDNPRPELHLKQELDILTVKVAIAHRIDPLLCFFLTHLDTGTAIAIRRCHYTQSLLGMICTLMSNSCLAAT